MLLSVRRQDAHTCEQLFLGSGSDLSRCFLKALEVFGLSLQALSCIDLHIRGQLGGEGPGFGDLAAFESRFEGPFLLRWQGLPGTPIESGGPVYTLNPEPKTLNPKLPLMVSAVFSMMTRLSRWAKVAWDRAGFLRSQAWPYCVTLALLEQPRQRAASLLRHELLSIRP